MQPYPQYGIRVPARIAVQCFRTEWPPASYFRIVVTFLLWCILLVLSWPLALLALVLYPIVWLLLIPFRLAGIAVEGVLGLVRGIVLLPARLLGGSRGR
jgi:hypothetical protein